MFIHYLNFNRTCFSLRERHATFCLKVEKKKEISKGKFGLEKVMSPICELERV